jgi:steroid delta-isomerase-like uncharacterized protein
MTPPISWKGVLPPWAASAFVGNVTRQQNFLVPLLSQGDMVGTLQSFSQDHSHERSATFMSVEENMGLMRRWFQEVWNEGRIQTIHDLLAPNAIGIGQLEDGSELRGPAAFVPFVERIRGAFPDTNIKVEDAFGASDKVVLRWSATMTHRGDHLGIPATGRPVKITGMTIARIADKKIIEGWDSWDQLAMLKQIGAYESPQATLLKSA